MSRRSTSLIPKLMAQMWEQMERPHRLLDQHFGRAMQPDSFFGRSRLFDDRHFFPTNYYRPLVKLMREMEEEEQQHGWSVIKHDKDKFHVALDVQQFKPEEINVKVVDDCIVVEGKHEEKQDDHGTISRHFIRKYMIPEQCDPEKASTTLSSDGVLTITAPTKPEAIEQKREKVLTIAKTGKPALENETEEKTEKSATERATENKAEETEEEKRKMAQKQ